MALFLDLPLSEMLKPKNVKANDVYELVYVYSTYIYVYFSNVLR